MAAGLEHHGIAASDERIHERINIVLQQRFTARDLDQAAIVLSYFGDHLIQRALLALVEGVLGVAPRTSKVAGCQPHEDARRAGARRFALDGIEDFVDRQHSGISTIVSAWGTCASERPAGTIRPAAARGTASSTPPRKHDPRASTSFAITRTISIRLK